MQLIRRQIANICSVTGKLDSNVLIMALDAFNKSLIKELQEHYQRPESKPYPDESNNLIAELDEYLQTTGLHDPYSKVLHLNCIYLLFVFCSFLFFINFRVGLIEDLHHHEAS
jgi:WASH complex subunit strumpellin